MVVGAHQGGAIPRLAVHLGAVVRVVVERLAGVEVLAAGHQVGVVMVGVQHMAVATVVGLRMAVTAHGQHMVALLRMEARHLMVAQRHTAATMARAQLMGVSTQGTARLPGAVQRAVLLSRLEVSRPLLQEPTTPQHLAHMRLRPLELTALTPLPHLVVRLWTRLLQATILLLHLETLGTSMARRLQLHPHQALGNNQLHQHQAERIQVIIEWAKI